jgi:hypothetical protein
VASAVLLGIAVIVTMVRYPWFRVLDETATGVDSHLERSGADLDTPAHLIVEPLE